MDTTPAIKSAEERPSIPLNKAVFFSAAILIFLFTLVSNTFPKEVTGWLNNLQANLSNYLGWYYILVVAAYLIFIVILAFSRYGKIKLGPDDSKPDFSYGAWAGMLFSSGIGISLLYFGASEALTHYFYPPTGSGKNLESEQLGVVYTFLHWGVHGWAIYALIAVTIGYFSYRFHRPLALRTALYPILGNKTDGWAGNTIDCFGIIVTVFGLVSNLGIGSLQISAGIEQFFNLPQLDYYSLLIIMAIMMITATIVALSGIESGIKRLSNVNITFFILLFLFILFTGPTTALLNKLTQNIGDYLNILVLKTFDTYAYQPDRSWLSKWTLFYWAWWIAWGPFVGLFIARISRGRTIREVVIGVLLLPLGFTLAWLSVFGNSVLDIVVSHNATSLAEIALQQPALTIYKLLTYYPMSDIFIAITIFVGFVLFLTPADSGVIMLSNLSVRHYVEGEDAPRWLRIFWACMIFGVTAGLMYANNIIAIQTMIVLASLPFSVVMLLYIYCLLISLKKETQIHH